MSNHHHISVMQLGHLLTRSRLTFPEVSSKVCRDSFCQSGSSVSLPWVIYYQAFYLHVVSSSYCIPIICPKLVLFLIHLQIVYLFCNLSECILLFFSCMNEQFGRYIGIGNVHRRKANWVGHILHRNCLLKQVIEGKTERNDGKTK